MEYIYILEPNKKEEKKKENIYLQNQIYLIQTSKQANKQTKKYNSYQ